VSQQLTPELAGETDEILGDRHPYLKLSRADASDALAPHR